MTRRSILFAVVLAMLLSFATVTAPAQAATVTGTVSTYRLFVRATPSTKAAKVATLSEGASVTIVGRDSTSTWIKITADKGVSGWVKVVFIKTKAKIKDLAVAP